MPHTPLHRLALSLGCVLLMATATACAPELDGDHPGWKDPNCWQCHKKDDTHNSDKLPYQCAECHGNNGAKAKPAGHTDKTTCADCHGAKHGGKDFPVPVSCQTCHTR